MANMFSGVLSLVMGIILVVSVVVPQVKSANTSGWSSSEIAVLGLISIVALLGLAYGAGAIFGLF